LPRSLAEVQTRTVH